MLVITFFFSNWSWVIRMGEALAGWGPAEMPLVWGQMSKWELRPHARMFWVCHLSVWVSGCWCDKLPEVESLKTARGWFSYSLELGVIGMDSSWPWGWFQEGTNFPAVPGTWGHLCASAWTLPWNRPHFCIRCHILHVVFPPSCLLLIRILVTMLRAVQVTRGSSVSRCST